MSDPTSPSILGLLDNVMLPLNDDFDWDSFINFESESETYDYASQNQPLELSTLDLPLHPISHAGNSVLSDDDMLPFIDHDFDWDSFFKFEPESIDLLFPPLGISCEPPSSFSQVQPPPLAPTNNPLSLATSASLPPMVESSASRQLITGGNAISQTQTKKGLQDFLLSFPLNESSAPPPSKRQAFSPVDGLKLPRFGGSRLVNDVKCEN